MVKSNLLRFGESDAVSSTGLADQTVTSRKAQKLQYKLKKLIAFTLAKRCMHLKTKTQIRYLDYLADDHFFLDGSCECSITGVTCKQIPWLMVSDEDA
ncbi:hypothetical protein BpHYR1_028509 [Brachionus plicatilis]|uniref:Uncharacterized protein n=1 Tax=Brachionus plicatilis TaxID=10195 RepID=A0A3M7Q3G0_BRAPC|nr:hypothetical protein BpHYR1_028509 [Brachionus plicatilis]